MPRERTPTWQRPKKILPPHNPYGLPAEGPDATRPVKRNPADSTQRREVPRPGQGNWVGQDTTIPTPTNDAYGR